MLNALQMIFSGVFSRAAQTQHISVECIIAVLIASEEQTGVFES